MFYVETNLVYSQAGHGIHNPHGYLNIHYTWIQEAHLHVAYHIHLYSPSW